MAEDTSGAVARRQLSRDLKRLRGDAGLTADEARARLGVSSATMTRIERGNASAAQVLALASIYDCSKSVSDTLVTLAKASKIKSWYRQFKDVIPTGFDAYLGLEETASKLRCYESELVPGILQTEGYARAIFATAHPAESADETEQRVQLRLKRQVLLTRENPALWHIILGESVLRRPIGGRAVMYGQLERLLEVALLPNIEIGVIPFSVGEHAGVTTGGPFVLMDFPINSHNGEPSEPTTLYVEGFAGDLYSVEKGEVESYSDAFARMAHQSVLGPKETQAVIEEALKKME